MSNKRRSRNEPRSRGTVAATVYERPHAGYPPNGLSVIEDCGHVSKLENLHKSSEQSALPAVRMQEPFTLVIFGSTGDLTARKLIPANFQLWRKRFFSRPFAVVGVGRRGKDDTQFRAELGAAVAARSQAAANEDSWAEFAAALFYHRADFNDAKADERLLLDAWRGDQTLFTRADEVAASWDFVTPILDAWRNGPAPAFPNYAAGSWGPAEADKVFAGCPRSWRLPAVPTTDLGHIGSSAEEVSQP